MNNIKAKWGVFIKALVVVMPLLAFKILFHSLGFEVITVGPIITALVAGVFFVIAMILSGVLADFKESERLPGELVACLEALYKDSIIASPKESRNEATKNIRTLTLAIITNFEKEGRWKASEVNAAIEKIDADIRSFAEKGVAPAFIVKLRNEIGNVKKICNRVEIIKETSFLPAGQAIAEFAISSTLVIMLLLKLEAYFESLILIGVIALIFTSVVLLIKDMDNPFEGYARVELKQLYKLDKYLGTISPE
jgi:hypothetical protein